MKLVRNVALSRKALRRHPIRTFLAVAGTAVGAAAVVTTVAVGNGAEREVQDRIDALGRNVLMVYRGLIEPTPTRSGTSGTYVTTLREGDSEAILANSRLVQAVAPAQERDLQLKYGNESMFATVRGTTPEYEEIRNFRTVTGRYFTHDENQRAERVVVIGWLTKEALFPDTDPIGQWLRIGRVPFRVVGVLEEKGLSIGGGAIEDDKVLIPIKTALRRVFNLDNIKMVYVQAVRADAMEEVAAEITTLLRSRRGARLGRPDDFMIENPRELLAAQVATANSFRSLVTGLGASALIVGGVGILSLMTLSVRARRSEVGLRIAVGARRRDVLVQFLLEAVAITGIGAVCGIVIGLGAVTAIGQWTEWRTVLSVPSAVLAFGSALFVGGLFGAYPAHRAASWHPVTALRAE
jgi:ABC-type antimicrobial peptide transport system permease subunit